MTDSHDIPIVYAHHHIWDLANPRYPWHEIPRLSYVDQPDLLTDAAWGVGDLCLEAHGLSCQMQIYPSQMADPAHRDASTPDIAMIINVDIADGLVTGDFSPWRRGIRLMARSPNVVLKISGFGILRPDWILINVRPLVEEAIEVLGADRVMFGTNFPVDKLFGDFDRSVDALFAWTHAFSHTNRIKVFATNAIRIYRIDSTSHY